MNKQELIEEIEDLKDLKELFGNDPNYIEIDTVIRLISKLDEPQPLKLKDVIKRIEGLNLGTQKIWLDEILNELGSDYGTLKYKDGYGQGKLEGEWVGQQLKDADKIRQELNKPVIPQFVADWIEEGRKHCKDVSDLFGFDFTNEEVGEWFLQENPFDLVARAWLDGYTVEKEKRYLVKIKSTGQCLGKYYINNEILSPRFIYTGRNADGFTRKELEQSGFGWVFDCPGIEIEEVEG